MFISSVRDAKNQKSGDASIVGRLLQSMFVLGAGLLVPIELFSFRKEKSSQKRKHSEGKTRKKVRKRKNGKLKMASNLSFRKRNVNERKN